MEHSVHCQPTVPRWLLPSGQVANSSPSPSPSPSPNTYPNPNPTPTPNLGSVPHWEGDCLPCALHMYKNESGVWNQTCVACPVCEPGFFRDGCGGPTAGSCTACQAGLMQTQASSYPCTSCQACAAGDYLASDSNP